MMNLNPAARVALYARTSTKEQHVENQLLELRRYAAARGWAVAREYVDHGHSGAKDSRPELNRLMSDVRCRRVDVIVVWKFDRFSRGIRHLVTAMHEFQELGVAFVSMTDGIDTSTSAGRAMFSIIGALAQLERDILRERVLAGLSRARAQGKRLGRPPRPVDADRVRLLRGRGLSLRQIAREMAISKDTAAQVLSVNPS